MQNTSFSENPFIPTNFVKQFTVVMDIFSNYYKHIASFGFTLLFLGLLYIGPIIHADTGSYLAKSIVRPPLYPLLLGTYTTLFGENFLGLVALQLALGFFGSFTLARTLQKIFSLNFVCTTALFLVLLTPYYGPGKFGNAILTEAICYPLYLFTFSALLRGLLESNTRQFIYFILFTALLILTRQQFLFVIPIFSLVFIYMMRFKKKDYHFKTIKIALFLIFLSVQVIDRGYHYLYHNTFSPAPFTGIQMIVSPLYLAKQSDIRLFKEQPQRSLFEKTFDAMTQKKLNMNANSTDSSVNASVSVPSHGPVSALDFTTYARFYENYNAICWGTYAPILSEVGVKDPFIIDRISLYMALVLIYANFKNFIGLFMMNIIFNLGGLYYALALGFIFIFSAIHFIKKQTNLSIAVLVSLLCTASNYCLIALVEPAMRRYTAYTDTIQVCMILILVFIAYRYFDKYNDKVPSIPHTTE